MSPYGYSDPLCAFALNKSGRAARREVAIGSREGAKKKTLISKIRTFQKPRKTQEVDTESVYFLTLPDVKNTTQQARQNDVLRRASEVVKTSIIPDTYNEH